MSTRFYVADDGHDVPTLWETRSGDARHDRAVLCRTELPGPQYRDLLWNVLVGVLAPTDEQLDQTAMVVHSVDPAMPWTVLPQDVRDMYLEQVRHVLAALTEVAAQ